jgi:hypothetical protein
MENAQEWEDSLNHAWNHGVVDGIHTIRERKSIGGRAFAQVNMPRTVVEAKASQLKASQGKPELLRQATISIMANRNTTFDGLLAKVMDGIANKAGIQLARASDTSTPSAPLLLDGEWAAVVDTEGRWKQEVIIQAESLEDLATLGNAVTGMIVDLGGGPTLVQLFPRGGWGVLPSAPPSA